MWPRALDCLFLRGFVLIQAAFLHVASAVPSLACRSTVAQSGATILALFSQRFRQIGPACQRLRSNRAHARKVWQCWTDATLWTFYCSPGSLELHSRGQTAENWSKRFRDTSGEVIFLGTLTEPYFAKDTFLSQFLARAVCMEGVALCTENIFPGYMTQYWLVLMLFSWCQTQSPKQQPRKENGCP